MHTINIRIQGFRTQLGNPWDRGQLRVFLQAAIENIGGMGGWGMLVPRLKRAVIADKAFAVVRSQCRETVAITGMDLLLTDLEALAEKNGLL